MDWDGSGLIREIIWINAVNEALFCLCRDTNIYNSFGGVSEFQDTYHGFLYFLTFLVFFQWILYIADARETQEDTL